MTLSPEPINILMVEDVPTDAELAQREIKQALQTVVFYRVETREDFLAALETFRPELIISDYRMPRFDGLTALKLAQEWSPLTPVIILTGAINEDTAVECMKAGAADYVIKEHLKRLGQAVSHALGEKKVRQERRRAEESLRESEERFRLTFQTNPDAINITRLEDGLYVDVNDGFTRLTGYAREDVVGQTSVAIKIWNDPADRQELIRGLQKQGYYENLEARFRRKDGSIVYGLMSARVIPLQGTPHIISITRDITERKQAEEARLKLEEQLRQAQKMESVGRLAGGVAHDFNNLLTVIQGHTMMMHDQIPAGHAFLEPLEAIQHAGERAAALTRQLLAFSRKQILAPRRLDLNHVVTNLRKMLERLIGEDIALSTLLQPDLWPITADPGQLEQVIVNLAVNARDAMPTGGQLTIETKNVYVESHQVQTHPEITAGPYILLSVSDNGCGMDEHIRAHLFEPFFTTKEVGKGTGLGLAMVYGIVKQSGGDISAYSESGHGTTFKIYLPAHPNSDSSEVSPPIQLVSRGGHETILLVEDEEMVRDLVQETLQEKGYTILQARLGSEALTLARQHQNKIDLLVTDVVMPQMSGRELAGWLKLIYPGIKVLFMSGYTDDAVVRHGLLTAEVEFLAKPFLPNALAAKVREILDK